MANNRSRILSLTDFDSTLTEYANICIKTIVVPSVNEHITCWFHPRAPGQHMPYLIYGFVLVFAQLLAPSSSTRPKNTLLDAIIRTGTYKVHFWSTNRVPKMGSFGWGATKTYILTLARVVAPHRFRQSRFMHPLKQILTSRPSLVIPSIIRH